MKIHPFKMLIGKRNLAVLAIGLVLLLYISFLIFSNYSSQVDLQKTALEKLRQDTEKLAMSVSYFCTERKIDLKDLAENRAISVYFENKALGMSMKYGLKASLNAIIYKFDRLLEETKFGGKRIYSRITFIRPNGELLVDTGLINYEQDQVRDWNKFLTPDSREVAFIDEHNPQIPMMIVTTPYFFKGNFSGQIIAWINLVDVYEHFVKKGGPSNGYTSFVSIKDHIYSPEYMQAKFSSFLPGLMDIEIGEICHLEVTEHTGIKRDMIVIRVPVKGTPLSLTRAMPSSDILGRRSPFHLLVAMAVLSIAVMIGMILFWRITTTNLVLEARFEEASKQRQEIEDKNRQLEKEINERQQAEEALKKSEKRYRDLFESISDFIYTYDLEGRFLSINPIAAKNMGYRPEEIIGQPLINFMPAKHQQAFYNEYLPQIKKQGSSSGVAKFLDKDGSKHYIEYRDALMKQKDGNQYVTGSGRDITARKRAEEELRKAHDELEIKVNMRTAELVKTNELLKSEIEERKRAELTLIERGKELENKTHDLEEVNAALSVLLKRREQDKADLEEKVLANVKEFVFPYVEKLNNCRLSDRQMVYLNIIKSNLEEIIAPFLHKLSSKYSDLTPREIQVAGLVKDGKTTKEIAELLNSSKDAIDFHRYNLRKKLGIRNTKTNLRSFLLTFT